MQKEKNSLQWGLNYGNGIKDSINPLHGDFLGNTLMASDLNTDQIFKEKYTFQPNCLLILQWYGRSIQEKPSSICSLVRLHYISELLIFYVINT